MIRVGFTITDTSNNWIGGLNYFKNLVAALNKYSTEIAPVILTGKKAGPSVRQYFHDVEIIESPQLDRRSLHWVSRKLIEKSTSNDFLLQKLLTRHNIQVVSHCPPLKIGIPTIGWIPDFQHLHLPELFSAKEIQNRNRYYSLISEKSTTVILSSNSARLDFVNFAPAHLHKAQTLRFSVNPMNLISNIDENVIHKYQIPERYFYVPNQFWVHKNHAVLLEALRNLNRDDIQVTIVASGNTRDHRNIEYFSTLMERVERYDLRENFRVIGVIPYQDVVALMCNSVAVINPSKFEGWSTSVEEAKALRKRLVLSDIPVHREQALGQQDVMFFEPSDSLALASALKRVWNEHSMDPGLSATSSNDSWKAFAKSYEEIVITTLRSSK